MTQTEHICNTTSGTEDVPASITSTVRIKRSVKDVDKKDFQRIQSFCIGHLYTFDLDLRLNAKSSTVDVKIKPRNNVPRYVVKLKSFIEDKCKSRCEFNETIGIQSGIRSNYTVIFCEPKIIEGRDGLNIQSGFKLDFQLLFDIQFSPSYLDERSFMADIRKNLSTSDTVRLISSNGIIEANKDLLTIRSSVFQAMFNNDTKEAETLQVDMANFNMEVLEAFVKFLMTDSIDDVEDTALGLFILGDKYDIPLLKAEAGRSMLNNLSEENFDEVFSWILKLQPELTKEAVKKFYVDAKNVTNDVDCSSD